MCAPRSARRSPSAAPPPTAPPEASSAAVYSSYVCDGTAFCKPYYPSPTARTMAFAASVEFTVPPMNTTRGTPSMLNADACVWTPELESPIAGGPIAVAVAVSPSPSTMKLAAPPTSSVSTTTLAGVETPAATDRKKPVAPVTRYPPFVSMGGSGRKFLLAKQLQDTNKAKFANKLLEQKSKGRKNAHRSQLEVHREITTVPLTVQPTREQN